MKYWRLVLPSLALMVVFAGCKKEEPAEEAMAQPAGPAPGTPEWKIADAMSAAPAEIGQGATIMDWPASEGAQPTQLRAGTNGWTCFPDEPNTPMDDPMCLDAQWMNWAQGYMSHSTPNITGVGISYMLKGGQAASMTDPFKMRPDSGQEWGTEGPHLMMIVPRSMLNMLSGIPDHPSNGGPWVMWKNTPYVHVMMPSRAGS
ncbi:MAG: hypothetical protein HYR48_07595 [Gemmatimonadetes bacterium]|nr:hypothetical protein [Gemmatimonadota bacterium]